MYNWFQNKSPTHAFVVDWVTWHCKWAAQCYFNGASPTGVPLFAVTSSVWRTLLCIILWPSVNWNWSDSPEMPNTCENPRFFVPCELGNWQMTLKNNRASLLYYVKLCASFNSHRWIQTGVSPETPNKGLNWWLFDNWDIEILQMTLKNNREPLPWYFKLCASFCSHWWTETGVTVRKRPIWVNIGEYLSPVTLKFDGWPLKTIGHLFYATSSYLHHSVAIGEFKLVLQSGNAQSGSKFAFKLWP